MNKQVDKTTKKWERDTYFHPLNVNGKILGNDFHVICDFAIMRLIISKLHEILVFRFHKY